MKFGHKKTPLGRCGPGQEECPSGQEPCDVDVFASAFSAHCVLRSPLTEANLTKQTACQFLMARLLHCNIFVILRFHAAAHCVGSQCSCKYFERIGGAALYCVCQFCATQRIEASDFVAGRWPGGLRLDCEAGNVACHVCRVEDVAVHESIAVLVTFDAYIRIIRRCLAAKRQPV